MYLERAKEEDEKMAESWKDEAGQVFLFVRVYLRCCTSYPFKRHRPVYLPLLSHL